jgi:MFS family permease
MPPRLLTLLVCLSCPAFAQPSLLPTGAAQDPVAAALHTWHRGERTAGFGAFVGAGLVTGVAGGLLLASGTTLDRSAGWPLLGVGALELIAGLILGVSSIGREDERAAALLADRAGFLALERPRVARISSRLQPILLAAEAAITLGGGVTAGVGALQRNDTLLGVGLGIAVQGLVLFLLDWAVLDRAQAYESALQAP